MDIRGNAGLRSNVQTEKKMNKKHKPAFRELVEYASICWPQSHRPRDW